MKTISGAGIITGTTIRAYVDDIVRFVSYKQFSVHAGLVPWVQSSNTRERYGNIIKQDPHELRTALAQIVLEMVRTKRRTGCYRIIGCYAAMGDEERKRNRVGDHYDGPQT